MSIDFDNYNDLDERVSTILPPVINGHAAQYPTIKHTTGIGGGTEHPTMVIRNESELLILKRPTSVDMNSNHLPSTFNVGKPSNEGTVRPAPTTLRPKQAYPETTFSSGELETPAMVTEVTEATTKANLFETIKTTLMSPKYVEVSFNEAKTGKPLITKMKKVMTMGSTPETIKSYGFTSGHQNNFGVPIEEDERILKMFDEQLHTKLKDTVKVRNKKALVRILNRHVVWFCRKIKTKRSRTNYSSLGSWKIFLKFLSYHKCHPHDDNDE